MSNLTTKARSLARRVTTGLLWAAAGGAAIVYGGALVYANVVRLEVDAAVIAGAVEPIRATADGVMLGVGIKPGSPVTSGNRLAKILDPEVERQVSLSSIQLERARHELRLREAELASEKAKRDDTLIVTQAELKVVQAEIASLEEQVATAKTRVERFGSLFAQGFAARHKLEDQTNELAVLNAQLSRARIVEEQRRALVASAEAGRFFDGSRIIGKLAELEAAVRRALAEVDVATEELRVWQERRAAAVVTASADGRIMRILHGEGSVVRAGDTVAVYERNGERTINAFLTQSEVVRIAVGDAATIYVPALRLRLTAHVATIDRAAGFLDDVESRYTWRQARDSGIRQGDVDRTARVVLRLDGDQGEHLRKDLEPGTPAVVSFQRRSIDTVLGDFRAAHKSDRQPAESRL
ncbi:MAG: HlyD family efflux transporter periplasmic adaptor subunit [Proteobacteria bacterium]|nr:HlyD family efflux transporter periplasmic adaptor subunit [Pseudomonadota bacterium]